MILWASGCDLWMTLRFWDKDMKTDIDSVKVRPLMFFVCTSTIKILQQRQEESKESSTVLISARVLLWALIWAWPMRGRPIHHMDAIRCDLGSQLIST